MRPAAREHIWLGLRPVGSQQRAAPNLVRRAYMTLRFALCAYFAFSALYRLTSMPREGLGSQAMTLFATIVEIGGAVVCAMRPRLGGWLLAGWLALGALHHLAVASGYQAALHQAALAFAAVALARLAAYFER